MSIYSDLILSTSNLVAYWRLGEASGNAVDASGNGNTGTPTALTYGAAGAIARDPDTACTFNGSTSAVNVTSTAALQLTSSWTYEAWFKRTTTNRNDPLFGHWTSTTTGRQILLYITTSPQNSLQIDIPWIAAILTGPTITDTNWHHVAFTKSGTTWTIYLDGTSVATTTNASAQQACTSDLEIGRSTPAGSKFSGSIDEVAIYSRALTLTEIAKRYAIGIQTNMLLKRRRRAA